MTTLRIAGYSVRQSAEQDEAMVFRERYRRDFARFVCILLADLRFEHRARCRRTPSAGARTHWHRDGVQQEHCLHNAAGSSCRLRAGACGSDAHLLESSLVLASVGDRFNGSDADARARWREGSRKACQALQLRLPVEVGWQFE